MTVKLRKAVIRRVDVYRLDQYEEVHYDLSGHFKTGLHGNRYAAHFMEPEKAKSDVFFPMNKSNVREVAKNYIANVESGIYPLGYCVRRIHCDNDAENLPT